MGYLRDEHRVELLRIARDALTGVVRRGEDPQSAAQDISAALAPFSQRFGAFVSLHGRNDSLRGCVGCMTSDRPLAEVVADMADAAARRDPRFSPVTQDEVDALVIEISVLSPTEPLDSVEDVLIGEDGLLVVGRDHRGVLLPQVASERGWDPQTFASQTCIKAQLSPDAWRDDDVTLYRFKAEVFSEPVSPSERS